MDVMAESPADFGTLMRPGFRRHIATYCPGVPGSGAVEAGNDATKE